MSDIAIEVDFQKKEEIQENDNLFLERLSGMSVVFIILLFLSGFIAATFVWKDTQNEPPIKRYSMIFLAFIFSVFYFIYKGIKKVKNSCQKKLV